MRNESEYAEDDMLCPWCGSTLPGKPGQYVKCRHCGSDIVWRAGKPFKTKVQAAFPNPVVREVPARFNKASSKDRPEPTEDFETGSMIIKFASSIFGDVWRGEREISDEKRLRQRAVAAKKQLNKLKVQKNYDVDSAKTRTGFGMIGLLYLSLVLVFVVALFGQSHPNNDGATLLSSVCGLAYFVFVIVAFRAIVKQIFYSRSVPMSGGTRDFVIVMTLLALLPIFVISGGWCLAGGFNVYTYLSSYTDGIKSSGTVPDEELFAPRFVELDLSDKDLSDKNLSGKDLSDKDLSDKNLSGVNLNGANLNGTNLCGANLCGANLSGAKLYGTNLTHADLTSAVLHNVILDGANLSNATLLNVDLSTVATLTNVKSRGITGPLRDSPTDWQLIDGYLIGPGANLSGANLNGADLSGANLLGANLTNADLTDADLKNATLSRGNLQCAKLRYANLADANLTNVNLAVADIVGAYLGETYLNGANLAGANLYSAKLMNTNLSGADLTGANLTGANLFMANLDDANLTGADLTSATLAATYGDAKYNDATKLPSHFEPEQYGWIRQHEK